MLRKYIGARKAILEERESHDTKTKMTKYASNPNYVYEPLKGDTKVIGRLKALGQF